MFFDAPVISSHQIGRGSFHPAAWVTAFLLTTALSACAEFRSHGKVESDGREADAAITANVEGLLAQHPELQGPDQLYVRTVDHVVYLDGTVEIGLHREIAASLARQVTGVTRVVDDIGIDK